MYLFTPIVASCLTQPPVPLTQCVISNDSPLIGVQLSDKVFQDHYQATVVGVRPSFKHGMSGGVTIPMRSLEPSTPSAEVTEVRLDLKETASTTSDVEHISIPHTSSSGSKSFVGIDDAMMSSTTSWNPNYRLLPGDAIVIEAHILLMHIHKNSDHFSLMREVSDSKPPISNDFMDQYVHPVYYIVTVGCACVVILMGSLFVIVAGSGCTSVA